MSLRLYNSLTREKEPFAPASPGEARMYVCGVTVYDLAHVGHARSALVFDMVRRYLVFSGYRVTFVKNFTDVDDKIIARAAQNGEPWQTLTERYIRAYTEDMDWLGVLRPDVEPRATGHIGEMIALIERLLVAGVAYVVDGDVYFEVRRFPPYGRLSGRSLDDLRAGARVDVDERKRDPLDFALWKAAKPGEPWWESPWGPGRPGWHVECSAMSAKYLGESFDLHGGGLDLVFPHHENEIAQSEAATGRPFVRCWLHNGFVQVGTEKMSKSLGNMLNVVDLHRHPPDALRLYLLSAQYRAPLEFRESRVAEFAEALERLRGVIHGAFHAARETTLPGEDLPWTALGHPVVDDLAARAGGDELGQPVAAGCAQFLAGMDDDFNTPQALSGLFELGRALNRYRDAGLRGSRLDRYRHGAGVLLVLARVLGLLWRETSPYEFSAESRAELEPLLAAREAARQRRDFARADEIRTALDRRGVVVEDTPGGPRLRWKRVPARP